MRWVVALLIVTGCSFGSPGSIRGVDAAGGGGDDASTAADAAPDSPPGAWWNAAWPARRRVVIANAVPLVQGFQIGIRNDLDLAPCSGARDAVRVVRDHTTELPRVIDELGGDEWIWFRLAAPAPATIGPSEYWVYCGNPGAGPAPDDPASVFDAYDDFNGAALSPAWSEQGTVSVGSGAVTLGGTGGTIHSTAAYGPGTATDFVLQASSAAIANPWFWGGFEVGFTVTAPWAIWHARDPNLIKQEILRNGQNPTAANAQALQLGAHLYGVEHHDMSAGFRYNNVGVGSIPYGGAIGQMNVRFHNYQSSGTIQLQMARVRKAVTPIPAVTLGEVETRP